MANNMDNSQNFDDYLAENPNFLDDVNFDNGLMTDADTDSLNPADLAMNNDFSNLNGFSAPQELIPVVPEVPQVPQFPMPNMAMGPSYSPMIGWYYPTTAPPNVPPPPMFPITGMTPVTSVPTSAFPSGTSTPIPEAANPAPAARIRTQGKRKYGPSAFLDAQAEGRTSIGNDEANYFASNASRREGRGDAKPNSFDEAFKRTKTRPSIVQACICEDHEAQRIKRPKNAFILYRLAKADEIRKSLHTTANQDVSKEAGEKWKAEPQAVKDRFYALAQEEKERHAKMFPDYQYKPGGHTRSKFGTAQCRCGAYQLNMARFQEKRLAKGGLAVSDVVAAHLKENDSDLDSAFTPSCNRPQAPAPTGVMVPQSQADLLDAAFSSLTSDQQDQAAAIHKVSKRKRLAEALTISTGRKNSSSEEPARKLRRTPRSTASNVNYTEPEDNIFGVNSDFDGGDDLFDFGASCKTSSSTDVGHFYPSPKDLRTSRQNSKAKSTASVSAASPSLFVSPSAPAKNTRSQSRANIKQEVVTIDSDSEDDNTVVGRPVRMSIITNKPITRSRQSSSRTTRSQATTTPVRRSQRSSGKSRQ